MASRRKQSEGIALLSMYNDEEEDEEMEEAGEEEGGKGEEFQELRIVEDAFMADSDRFGAGDSGAEESTPRDEVDSSPATPSRAQASMDSGRGRSRRGKLGIVDYGHDEVAMSPDPEEGEMDRTGHEKVQKDLQFANGDFCDKTPSETAQVLTPSNQSAQFYDPSQSDKVNYAVADSEAGNAADAIDVEEKDAEPLDTFLPSAPKAKCSEELQRKINKFLDYKKSGKSFNAEVRNRKDYRNPDFLLHAVSYQDIDQIGSCFSKDVFDPHGYDKTDFYDEIEADMRREMDRKEQERKKSQKVEFLSAGIQTGSVPGAAKINLAIPGIPTGLQSAPSSDAIPRDGSRQNKKSKWDKVDGDRRNPLPSGITDPTLVAGAQSAVLSTVNAGAGYMAFVQQKRREAEEKRSSDRKLERRS